MESLTLQLAAVRDLVRQQIEDELGQQVGFEESLMVRGGYYVGHRFRAGNKSYEWVAGESKIRVLENTSERMQTIREILIADPLQVANEPQQQGVIPSGTARPTTADSAHDRSVGDRKAA